METTDFMDRSRCVGYITGISDAHSTFATWGRMEPEFCVPTIVTKGQLRKFVVKLRLSLESPVIIPILPIVVIGVVHGHHRRRVAFSGRAHSHG